MIRQRVREIERDLNERETTKKDQTNKANTHNPNMLPVVLGRHIQIGRYDHGFIVLISCLYYPRALYFDSSFSHKQGEIAGGHRKKILEASGSVNVSMVRVCVCVCV
jgi:hypothetical protein